MKQRLLLILALSVLAAATVGTVTAQSADLLGSGNGDVSVDLPGGSGLPDVTGSLPVCSNLSDDDGDGAVDLGDPGCSGPTDSSEENPTAPPPSGETTTPPPGAPAPGTPPPSAGPTAPAPGTSTGGGAAGGGAGGGGAGGNGNGGTQTGGNGGGPGEPMPEPDIRNPDGTPTNSNPGLSIADFGASPIGVPNFMIDQFEIPPFLLPIYQACGTQYGIPWEVLASINKIESAFGTNMGPSTAGAVGWMQFLPSTWKAYGVDANDDGEEDPYNPVDAICAAARYLNAAGGDQDLRAGIFAYNHADWYVDEVLLGAQQYGKLPDDLIGSITGLTEGAHFPVAADARYADDISEREVLERSKGDEGSPYTAAADVIESSPTRRGINIYSHEGAPVVAVNDGVIKEIGHSSELGNYLVLEDAYGNRFTYAQLGDVADVFPVPKEHNLSADDFQLVSPDEDEQPPDQPATAGAGAASDTPASASSSDSEPSSAPDSDQGELTNSEDLRERLFAFPQRPRNVDRASLTGQLDQLLGDRFPGYETFKNYLGGVLKFDDDTMEMRPLEEGSKVVAGTVLGRIEKTDELAPHVHFMIRPAGKGAELIDPKPILDGWKLLESTAIYRARGDNPFATADVSQVLLLSKAELQRRALNDPRLSIYACGREDIQTGQIDRRVLATMEYLTARGYRLTITSLKCGHSYLTTSGNVSEHSTGDAMDIAQVNGIPILGNQGPGSITEAVIQDLLMLQGPMEPHQIISLMDMGGPTFVMADHDDHIHVGYAPEYGDNELGQQFESVLDPDQWQRLIEQLGKIDNPQVPQNPSQYSLPAGKQDRASDAHLGE
jgi:transglycosylase-like protein with SLT domain